jgi:hypothetical protein
MRNAHPAAHLTRRRRHAPKVGQARLKRQAIGPSHLVPSPERSLQGKLKADSAVEEGNCEKQLASFLLPAGWHKGPQQRGRF